MIVWETKEPVGRRRRVDSMTNPFARRNRIEGKCELRVATGRVMPDIARVTREDGRPKYENVDLFGTFSRFN